MNASNLIAALGLAIGTPLLVAALWRKRWSGAAGLLLGVAMLSLQYAPAAAIVDVIVGRPYIAGLMMRCAVVSCLCTFDHLLVTRKSGRGRRRGVIWHLLAAAALCAVLALMFFLTNGGPAWATGAPRRYAGSAVATGFELVIWSALIVVGARIAWAGLSTSRKAGRSSSTVGICLVSIAGAAAVLYGALQMVGRFVEPWRSSGWDVAAQICMAVSGVSVLIGMAFTSLLPAFGERLDGWQTRAVERWATRVAPEQKPVAADDSRIARLYQRWVWVKNIERLGAPVPTQLSASLRRLSKRFASPIDRP